MTRRTFYIDRSFQLKLVGFLGLISLAAVINILMFVYYHQLKVAQYVSFSTTDPVSMAQEIVQMSKALMWKLFGVGILMMTLFIYIGFWLTHRVAGPMFKLRGVLQDYFMGKTIQSISFRKDDEFKDVLDNINKLLVEVSKKRSS